MTIELGSPIDAALRPLEPNIGEARRVGVKLLARADERTVDLSALIPAFHGWIQRRELSDQLEIDIVDFRHLSRGPAVLLVCHEGHYAVERGAGALGLSYRAKREEPDTFSARLQSAARRALSAAEMLQQQRVANLTFRGDRLRVEIADRLHAPNTEQTFEAARGPLQQLAARLYPAQSVQLSCGSVDPRALFCVELQAPTDLPLGVLRARLGPFR